jgi:hypothetical protein
MSSFEQVPNEKAGRRKLERETSRLNFKIRDVN